MKLKCLIPIILMLVMLQLVWGVDCDISTDNSTWTTIESSRYMGCSDDTGELAVVNKLNCSTEYNIRCKDDTTAYGYETFTTDDCGEKEPMAALAITIFILIISAVLFTLSMKKEIVKNKYANIIIRRSFLVLGIYLMILNSAIMATIAVDAGLALEQEMFFYMKLFGYMGYPAMVYLMLSALFQTFSDMKQDKKKKRTGDEDGE